MQSGIYKIVNIINNKLYIGSAVNIRHRWCEHKRGLMEGVHHSIHLQRSWNEYGGELNFTFEIIEECEKCDLIKREQYWLDYYKSYEREFGYNICKYAGNTLGFKFSKESKKKMSEKRKKRITKEETRRKKSEMMMGEKNHMYGKHFSCSEEIKQIFRDGRRKGEKNANSKLTINNINEIREKYKSGNYTHKQLSKEYNVSDTNIYYIINNKTWKE